MAAPLPRTVLSIPGITIVSTPAETEKKPAKSKKLLIIVVVLVVVLAIAGAAVAYVLAQRHSSEDGEEGAAEASKSSEPAVVPTFLPVDTMVVNLADNGGERFAQVGITLELADAKTADRLKQFMPSIRSALLLLISQRTAEELLRREGKEALAHDILREVSRPLGFDVPAAGPATLPSEQSASPKPEKSTGKGDKKAKDASASLDNPVRKVLFSGFIVQ